MVSRQEELAIIEDEDELPEKVRESWRAVRPKATPPDPRRSSWGGWGPSTFAAAPWHTEVCDSAKLRHLQPYHLLLLRGTQTADAKMGC